MKNSEIVTPIQINNFFDIINPNRPELKEYIKYLQSNHHGIIHVGDDIVIIPPYVNNYHDIVCMMYNMKQTNPHIIRDMNEKIVIECGSYDGILASAYSPLSTVYSIYQNIDPWLSNIYSLYFPNIRLIDGILSTHANASICVRWDTDFTKKCIMQKEPARFTRIVNSYTLEEIMKRYAIPHVDRLSLRMWEGSYLAFIGAQSIIYRDRPNIDIRLPNEFERTLVKNILAALSYNIYIVHDVLYAQR